MGSGAKKAAGVARTMQSFDKDRVSRPEFVQCERGLYIALKCNHTINHDYLKK